MSRLTTAMVAASLVVPAAAATTARPSLGLTASPAHVTLHGSSRTTVRVTNTGSSTVTLDVGRAGFGLDLRGRPRILTDARDLAGESWLTVRPRSFTLRPGSTAGLTVAAKVPSRAEPGDHSALVLVTARPRPRAGLVVRMRLGVVVDVRAAGRIVHDLVPLRLRLQKPNGHLRTLELLVANRGNVTEELGSGRAALTLSNNGRTLARVRGEPRRLLPRTRGVIIFRYRGPSRGAMSAVVTLAPTAGGRLVRWVSRARL